jgi:predicted DsbA family dithiol-disulfide isomerase
MLVDVFQDTVCPWCWIGKRHLQAAIAQWTGTPVTVRYHPFFLNPNLPPAGEAFVPYMLAKGGGQMTLEDFFAAPRKMGAQVGITFNFEAIQRAPNTLLSHRLIALTPEAQRPALIEALFTAYFTDGQDIGDIEVLLQVAARCGLAVPTLRNLLQGPAAQDEVLAEVAMAQQIGVRGVPFFVLNNTLAFSGAHPPENILRAMQQAASFGVK